MADADPFTARHDGVVLAVRLTPKASRSGIDGVRFDADGAPRLQLRVAAPPVDGAANAALVQLLARALGLRKADVVIETGPASRLKRVHLRGNPGLIVQNLRSWIATAR